MNSLQETNYEEALNNTALTFEIMIDECESGKKTYYGRSPFFFGKSFTFQNRFYMGIGGEPRNNSDHKLGKFIANVGKSIEALQKALKLLSFGLDYKKHSRFMILTPYITKNIYGGYIVQKRFAGEKGLPTIDDV